MERLTERLHQTEKAMLAFQEVLNAPYSKIIRDAALKRFEFTVESLWKLAQRFILLKNGIDVASPKGVIRGCFQANLINEQQTEILLKAIDDRNLTSHTYNEELAETIFRNLPNYQPEFQVLFNNIKSLL